MSIGMLLESAKAKMVQKKEILGKLECSTKFLLILGTKWDLFPKHGKFLELYQRGKVTEMQNNLEVEMKKQMVPKYGKSLCFILTNIGILLERNTEKYYRMLQKLETFGKSKWAPKRFLILRNKRIFSPNMRNY